jgi:hypothetical protein
VRKGLTLPESCTDIAYPREAIRQRLGDFDLVYELHVDERGAVRAVTFPRTSERSRPFERAAQPVLMKCRFVPDGTRYVAIGEIVFRLKEE